MKLVLLSYHISEKVKVEVIKLLGKPPYNSTLAFIPTPANGEEGEKAWLVETRDELEKMGFKIEILNLEDYVNKPFELKEKLMLFDTIYVSGGNTFYLMYYVQKSGFEIALKNFLRKGNLYMGASAGAIIFNPDMIPIGMVDNPSASPDVIKRGIKLIDFVVIPHWETKEFSESIKQVNEYYVNRKIKTIPIKDDEAVVVENDEVKKV